MNTNNSKLYKSTNAKDPGRYFNELSERINNDLAGAVKEDFPPNLYDPVRYVLESRGKRFRPVVLLMACEAVGGSIEHAYHASLAIEILHNFTLVHDDIMDNDELRRGQLTVHKKWNNNIAILAGDGLIALAYRFLLETESDRIKKVIQIFSEAIINVCEGQSIDKDFELESNVSMDAYIDMITRKTAVLISISAELGGLLGNGTNREVELLKKFGYELGIAFQIQDDLLDIISDEVTIGKDLGSDITEGKKTYPLIVFSECASLEDAGFLRETLSNGNPDAAAIEKIKTLLYHYNIVEKTHQEVNKHIDAACAFLKEAPGSFKVGHLFFIAEMIRNRTF